MSARFPIWFLITLLLTANLNGETLLNPPTSSVYHCGINEDCIIRCTTQYACERSTFYVYNHKVSLECSGENSCYFDFKLIASNVTELNITATGDTALYRSEIIVDSSNTKVNTVCNSVGAANHACYMARFHYHSQEIVNHICDGNTGCYFASIHAVSPIKLHCKNSLDACYYLSIVWPTDSINVQQSQIIIDVNDNLAGPYYVYAANTAYVPNIICPSNCNNIRTTIIYGTLLDESCAFKDGSCATTMASYNDIVNANTVSNNYYGLLNSGNYQFQQPTLLVIFKQDSSITFTSNNIGEGQITVLCFFCENMVFDFSAVSHASLVAVRDVRNAQIYGPSNYFQSGYIYGGDSIRESQFYLQHTTSVRFNGIPESGYSAKAEIHLNNQIDVKLAGALSYPSDCGSGICSIDGPVEIIQSIGQSVQDVVNYGWNVLCDSYSYDCLLFNLTTANPTISPTKHPSISPTNTPSKYPSISPTQYPSITPTTVSPTIQLLIDPTKGPTLSPFQSVMVDTGTTNDYASVKEAESDLNLSSEIQYAIIVSILIIILAVIIACTICCITRSKKQNKIECNTIQMEKVTSCSPRSPPSSPNTVGKYMKESDTDYNATSLPQSLPIGVDAYEKDTDGENDSKTDDMYDVNNGVNDEYETVGALDKAQELECDITIQTTPMFETKGEC